MIRTTTISFDEGEALVVSDAAHEALEHLPFASFPLESMGAPLWCAL